MVTKLDKKNVLEMFDEMKEFIITRKIKIPRNTYINNAISFYNQVNHKLLIKKQLNKESKLVSTVSREILKEFEKIEDEYGR